MSSGFSGMDVAGAEDLTSQIDAHVAVLNEITAVVDNAVRALADVWEGPDLDAFTHSWFSAHRPAALLTISDIRAFTQGLRYEIEQQQAASASPIMGTGWAEGWLGAAASGSFGVGLVALTGALRKALGSQITSTAYQEADVLDGELGTLATALGSLSGEDVAALPADLQSVFSGVEDVANSDLASGVGTAMGLFDAVTQTRYSWTQLAGESRGLRTVTAGSTGAADFAITRDPVTAGANTLSVGSVTADANCAIRMLSGFAYGVSKGGIGGGLHDANLQLDQWANDVAGGQYGGPLALLAHAENGVIGKVYGPVSDALGSVSQVGGEVTCGAEHLASRLTSWL